ncbi:MAG: hypothetical protein JOY80_00040 [Candidatus Dormibacteraeota bacterium]|nr:hypothetical protein [Candidatus Dormibacteraeota bacterium]
MPPKPSSRIPAFLVAHFDALLVTPPVPRLRPPMPRGLLTTASASHWP